VIVKLLSAFPLRSLRLCGVFTCVPLEPQRRRERRGSAEKNSNFGESI
jgi:hypothetical protein